MIIKNILCRILHLTNSSTAKQEEMQEERGSCQTLSNLPLRSIRKDLRQQDI